MQHTYSITGMTCSGCAASVEEQLSKVSGVQKVDVDFENAKASIVWSSMCPCNI
jgi:copper chaperone CopZ